MSEVPASMRAIVTERFSLGVLDEAAERSEGWMVLVMDDTATRVISSVLTMYDIMEKRVTLVERLNNARQPYKDMDVIYLIAPTIEATNTVIKDFSTESKRKYNNIHLFYLDAATDQVMALLQSSNIVVDRLLTLKEVNMDFISPERNVFHCDCNDSLARMYGRMPDATHAARMARQLATMCVTLNEHPTIRYQANSPYAKEIAERLDSYLKGFQASDPTLSYRGDAGSGKERGQLLVVDRSFDVATPLMHEYTYQAMANDVLNVDDGIVSFKTQTGGTEKQALLNENDEMWVEFRHKHIATVVESIRGQMRDLLQNNAGAALAKNSGADMTISQMATALKRLPEFRQIIDKLDQHVSLTAQCLKQFGGPLLDLSHLEQSMTTGTDQDGRKVKNSDIELHVQEHLGTTCATKLGRLRILGLLMATSRGGQGLMASLKLTAEEQAVLNAFTMLANKDLDQSAIGKTVFSNMFASKAPKELNDGDIADTRHETKLKAILTLMSKNELPTDAYPITGPRPAAKGAEPVAQSARTRRHKKDVVQFKGGRLMAFVAGGLSYSEMRVGNDLEKELSREVIMGGSHLISPKKYVASVAALHPDSAKIDLDEALVLRGGPQSRQL